ncbi:MAG TPA: hypothetical protein VHZ73_13175 [Vicinamibacterales bacterium]|jgi:hypothetical protein|nr:hypothetical protein [Vicinamibacterales bacterium]
MIKTLVKLALAALIANAVWRVGIEYITELKFKDAVTEAAIYEGRGDIDLRQRVSAIAAQFDVPQDDDDVKIDRNGRHISVSGAYTKPIEIIPGHPYDWRFAWNAEADAVQGKNGAGDPSKGVEDGR